MGVYVPNFRSVSFFVWPGSVTHIHTRMHPYTRENGNILNRLFASRGFWQIYIHTSKNGNIPYRRLASRGFENALVCKQTIVCFFSKVYSVKVQSHNFLFLLKTQWKCHYVPEFKPKNAKTFSDYLNDGILNQKKASWHLIKKACLIKDVRSKLWRCTGWVKKWPFLLWWPHEIWYLRPDRPKESESEIKNKDFGKWLFENGQFKFSK